MTIDGNISDLFFNTDNSGAVIINVGPAGSRCYGGYEEEKLRDNAKMFIACLQRLGCQVPTVDELIADFYRRI